ncbi:MAG: hypothetical protein LBQ66_06585 [Planctomycetaceae bacterium]|jgi:hypothetical protein|nr:hypothetical protein [Planctomycetaceae bacterium]
MFISKTPNRNSPSTYLLRESYRENRKVKKWTLANLTKLGTVIIAKIQEELKVNKLVPVSEVLGTTEYLSHDTVEVTLAAKTKSKILQHS